MAGGSKQEENVKRATWKGATARVGWGGRWGLLVLLWMLLWPGLGATLAQAAPFAYIANYGENTVSVIDTATNTEVALVPVGSGPYGVAVNPAGTKVYVTNNSSNNVSVINAATKTVIATIPVGTSPKGVAVNPAGTKAYVANFGDDTISVIDTATNTVVTTVTVGSGPTGIAMNPRAARAYVTNYNSGTVSVIDTGTDTVFTTTSYISAYLFDVVVHPRGTFIYVIGYNNVYVVSTATNTVVAVVTVGVSYGMAINPAGTKVYVSTEGNNTVSVIDTATNTVTTTIPVGRKPFGVAVHPEGTFAYVPNQVDANVSVIDTATDTVTGTIEVGVDPQGFGQFVGPAAPPLPAFTLSLTGCTQCRPDDRLTVQAHVTNLGPTATPVELKVGVHMPDGTPINLLGKHVEHSLPPGMDTTVTIFSIPVPRGIPAGNWSVEGALLEPELGPTLSRDMESFEVLP